MASTTLFCPSHVLLLRSSPSNIFSTRKTLLLFGPPSASLSPPSAIRINDLSTIKRRKRGLVVTRAGPPTTTNLIFAFVFPLSLLAVTIFTSIRIADKLDQDFIEELALNEAIMEEEDSDLDVSISLEQETAPPRTRNRPKRET
ncbi:high chlorophyll fluorescence 153 [Tasmannia lanceolata]|uniref:high chlorophyll fluorescence 153 n=1 Tax=Tasmannia lanceolata TaxID=3420 RepID=UPI004062B723